MWRRAGRRGTAWILAASLLAGACATTTTAPLPSGAVKPDDLLVVDCLLPGQIRQLGGQTTYLSRGRAIKTSARDCAIRGGEYVAFDRANYATALKVWLPQAEQGDVKAQTNVGEIFEKGLGVPPDYDAAAQWYRKAAEHGYSTAALNLGSLYERGLGVPKDPNQALNWYRRGAGLNGLTFDLTAPAATNEVQALRAQNQQLRQELDAKTAAMSKLEQELETSRRALEGRRSQADTERDTATRLRRELEQTKQREGAGTARVQQLERQVGESDARVAARDKEVADLRTTVAKLETERREQRERLERLRQQTATAGAGPSISLIEPELRLTRDASASPRADIAGDRAVVVGRVVSEIGRASCRERV